MINNNTPTYSRTTSTKRRSRCTSRIRSSSIRPPLTSSTTIVSPVRAWSRCARRHQSCKNHRLYSLRSPLPQSSEVSTCELFPCSNCTLIVPVVCRRHQHARRPEVAAAGVQAIGGGERRASQTGAGSRLPSAARAKSEFLYQCRINAASVLSSPNTTNRPAPTASSGIVHVE